MYILLAQSLIDDSLRVGAISQKVGAGHANAIAGVRHRQHSDVDRVAPAQRFGGDVVGVIDAASVEADARLGDEVVLLGGEITVEELAKRTDQIPYEVFCRISRRVPRVYR